MNQLFKILFTAFIVLMVGAVIAGANVLGLPVDSEGWTVFTPSSDSRIIYVSTSGNDTTGQVYSRSSFADVRNPGTVNAYRTYAAAYAQSRNGYPDWILFKRGDTFDNTAFYNNIRSGRSKTEPFLISDYGGSGAMPVINNRQTIGIYPTGLVAYWAVTNLDFYNFHRNPSDPRYEVGVGANSVVFVYSAGDISRYSSHDFMFEGNRFTYHAGLAIQGENTYNAGFYRNVVLHAYSLTTNRPQGIYSSYVNNLELIENIFDHNGWFSTVASGGMGPADPQNHNVYLTNLKNSTIKNNISTRPSSMHFKFSSIHYPPQDYYAGAENVTLENNLMIDGEIGPGVGGNDTTVLRYKNMRVVGNVLTNMNTSRSTSREIVWANDLQDWDGGSWSNNLMMNTTQGNSFSFSMMGSYRNVTFDNNVVYDVKGFTRGVYFDPIRNSNPLWSVSGCLWTNNKIILPNSSSSTLLADAGWAVNTGWTFSGNRYYSTGSDGARFRYRGALVSDTAYKNLTGDNFTWGNYTFPDATRSIETYMTSIGDTPSVATYIDRIRTFGRYNWPQRYMADSVTSWVKAGFGIGSVAPPPVCDSAHLYLCVASGTCTAAGGNWCDGACQSNPCPVVSVCDANHLSLCVTGPTCTTAGGNWCDNTCQADVCTPEEPEEPVVNKIFLRTGTGKFGAGTGKFVRE